VPIEVPEVPIEVPEVPIGVPEVPIEVPKVPTQAPSGQPFQAASHLLFKVGLTGNELSKGFKARAKGSFENCGSMIVAGFDEGQSCLRLQTTVATWPYLEMRWNWPHAPTSVA
jgi:hypothetical protein